MNRPRTGLRTLPLSRTRTARLMNPVGKPQATPRRTTALLDAAVAWGYYLDGVRSDGLGFEASVSAAKAGEGFLWLGLHEPTTDQLTQLGEIFGLHPLSVEDASNADQRPKFERYDDTVVLAVRTLAYVEHEARSGRTPGTPGAARGAEPPPAGGAIDEGGDVVETGTIMVFVGEWFVATVRHGRHASMTGLRRRLEDKPEQLALGPSAVLHAVVDKVVDDYLGVVEAIEDDIEAIESSVFAARSGSNVERIYQLKRDVIEMKRTVRPLGPPLRELAERPQRLVHPDIREYFRDVDDHLARVREQIGSYDEVLTTILQAGLARLSIAENEDMRKISAWVAIAAVPTMIAGIYGMNFEHMPELRSTWGYPAVLALMALVCGTLYRGFRRNGWL
jgi:magnesium transporter